MRRPRRFRLVTLVQRFVETDSWSASLIFLERHPALLSGDADDILTDRCALASAQGDSAAAHTFEVHQAALRSYLKPAPRPSIESEPSRTSLRTDGI